MEFVDFSFITMYTFSRESTDKLFDERKKSFVFYQFAIMSQLFFSSFQKRYLFLYILKIQKSVFTQFFFLNGELKQFIVLS